MSGEDIKPDAQQFLAILDNVKQQSWFSDRNQWADYLFQFTDATNAASILQQGLLLSRMEAKRRKTLHVDSASSNVIDQTREEYADLVRFYFRPRTPMAYLVEGFRPKLRQYQDAHCPVPVYFLFNMRRVISLGRTKFSDGSLASKRHNIYDSADDFARLQFNDIYSDVPWGHESTERVEEIKFRRHTEVVYPSCISLDYLQYIYCRSNAEKETLRSLLPSRIWAEWKSKIVPSSTTKLCHLYWLFIENVVAKKGQIRINFHIPSNPADYGPFNIMIEANDKQSNTREVKEFQQIDVVTELENASLEHSFVRINSDSYSIRVLIDGNLAYAGECTEDETPF